MLGVIVSVDPHWQMDHFEAIVSAGGIISVGISVPPVFEWRQQMQPACRTKAFACAATTANIVKNSELLK